MAVALPHYSLPTDASTTAPIAVQGQVIERVKERKPNDSCGSTIDKFNQDRRERKAYERGKRDGELGESYGLSRDKTDRGW